MPWAAGPVRYLRTGSPRLSMRGNVNACTAFQAKTARAAGVIAGNRGFARPRSLPWQYA
jgi:hypothetical protein